MLKHTQLILSTVRGKHGTRERNLDSGMQKAVLLGDLSAADEETSFCLCADSPGLWLRTLYPSHPFTVSKFIQPQTDLILGSTI